MLAVQCALEREELDQRGLNSTRGPHAFQPLRTSAPRDTLLHQKAPQMLMKALNLSRAACTVKQHMHWTMAFMLLGHASSMPVLYYSLQLNVCDGFILLFHPLMARPKIL